MALVENWGYGETIVRFGEHRREGRYVGRMSKIAFQRTVSGGRVRGNWIKDRMGKTGNAFELSLISQYPNKVILYDSRTYEILKIL